MNALMTLKVMVPIETLRTLVALEGPVVSQPRPTMISLGTPMLRADNVAIFEFGLLGANGRQAAVGVMRFIIYSVRCGRQRG